MESKRLAGKTALVTAAASGIGRASAEGFARAGARFGHGALSGVNALVGPSGSFLGGVLGGVVGRALGLPAVFLLGACACAGAGWLLRRNA